MTIKQDILVILQNYPHGIDDDELARQMGLISRQVANSRCRQLEKEGLIIRQRVNGKIQNFPSSEFQMMQTIIQTQVTVDKPKFDLWFWEGNVQKRVVQFLQRQNYQIVSEADTASHQRGKDIIAEKDDEKIWVTVKGYPKGTKSTRPSTQSGHWFSHAVFDILTYRGEDSTVKLGVALPDFQRYRKLALRISWLKPIANFVIFWVQENGEVIVE